MNVDGGPIASELRVRVTPVHDERPARMRARPARATSRSSSVALGCLDVVVVDDEDDLSDVDIGVDAV